MILFPDIQPSPETPFVADVRHFLQQEGGRGSIHHALWPLPLACSSSRGGRDEYCPYRRPGDGSLQKSGTHRLWLRATIGIWPEIQGTVSIERGTTCAFWRPGYGRERT